MRLSEELKLARTSAEQVKVFGKINKASGYRVAVFDKSGRRLDLKVKDVWDQVDEVFISWPNGDSVRVRLYATGKVGDLMGE